MYSKLFQLLRAKLLLLEESQEVWDKNSKAPNNFNTNVFIELPIGGSNVYSLKLLRAKFDIFG